ncbi:MAG: tRNA (adenosine(37)-N6)-threonylcarbamoyltransferase complex ATPase subunit type 1 TsaE [Sedimentisphaerales bacterium]|nr:tRNA (adenosine(37)-N6)-threonylcarbamoyltransferase complex ATPase subunit type 1 TsaE [Sedimentisphaerales bacterium]
MNFEFTSKSPDETIKFGAEIGRRLKGGEVIGLIGQLGSGKTHLIKGIAQGCGGEDCQKNVNSPTFVIVNEYTGRVDIYHIDCYRLNSVAEFEMLGFDDYCRGNSVVLIEWADRVLPALAGVDLIKIELAHQSQNKRQIRITNAPGYINIS